METDWKSELRSKTGGGELGRALGNTNHFNITHIEGVIKEGEMGGWKKKRSLKSLKGGVV